MTCCEKRRFKFVWIGQAVVVFWFGFLAVDEIISLIGISANDAIRVHPFTDLIQTTCILNLVGIAGILINVGNQVCYVITDPELLLMGSKSTGFFGFGYVLCHIAIHAVLLACFLSLKSKRNKIQNDLPTLWLCIWEEIASFTVILVFALSVIIAGCITAWVEHKKGPKTTKHVAHKKSSVVI